MKLTAPSAFALQDIESGAIVINSIGYTPSLVRKQAVESEREYLLADGVTLSDKQVWKSLYRQGWRVIPVTITPAGRLAISVDNGGETT